MPPASPSSPHAGSTPPGPARRDWLRWPRALLDVLLPRECALCEVVLDAGESVAGICAACVVALPGAGAARCPRCGLRDAAGPCPACPSLDAPTPGSRTVVCCDYAPPADRLVTTFKYGRRIVLGRAIGSTMAAGLERFRGVQSLPDGVLLVPVPIAPARLAQRGFDQAAVLAHQVGIRCGLPVATAGLARARATRPQPGLARDDRDRNLRGAMRGSPSLAGRPLVLVDDVITTGATLREAERACRAAGGSPVLRLAFARTPMPANDPLPVDATT